MLVLLAALLGLVAVGGPAGSSGADPGPPDRGSGGPGAVVRTDLGLVRGRVAEDHVTYSGIPYAAPPVGERRWAPPSRPRPWSGVRDATAPGSPCPQLGSGEDGSPVVVGEEDCLYVNVTAPRRAGRSGGDGGRGRLPVMVWVHGGGSTSGAGSEFDGARLATGGDVVVVTLNYRLGALGFLSSPALDGRGRTSGNHGIEDQRAALRWVQRNVASFGGDPGNVTLFGQSSGARTVCAHLASPGSQGLYAKAITQSGACATALVTKDVADERGERAAAALGCTAPDPGAVAACLRSRPVADLLRLFRDARPPVTGEYRDQPWQPVVGTPVLPRQPIEALERGAAADVPLLVGANRDEMRPFVGFEWDAVGNPLTVEGYEAQIADAFGADAEAVLAEYPAAAYPSPALALATVLSDWGGSIGTCPVLRTAEVAARHGRVFAYELAEESPEVYQGFPLGAYHGWDLPFLWDLSLANGGYPPLDEGERALSDRMIGWWTAFAHGGDPNGDSDGGGAEWPRFRPGDGTVLSLAAGPGGVAPVDFAAAHHCEFWSGL